MTNKLLTRTEQYNLQKEYGVRAWSADALGAIGVWPTYPGKSGLFEDQRVSRLESRLGYVFTDLFEQITEWNNHQMETTAFYHRQKQQPSELYLGDQFAAVVARKHKDDPTIEVTMQAFLHGSTRKLSYNFLLGLEYQGDDEHFKPETAPELSFKEALLYKLRGRSADERESVEKFPLLGRRRGAQIEYLGTLWNPYGELKLKVRDERLEKIARELYSVVERNLKE